LIDEYERSTRFEPVHKLASLPPDTIDGILIRRGIALENVEEVASLLATAGSPFTAEQVVASSFERRYDRTLPFRFGRFGDGKEYPVYYSAIEAETCIEEVKHRARRSFEAMQSGELPYSKFYQFISSTFEGVILILCGHEGAHRELVSSDESGYPFCQSLARQARALGIAAFHTPSARLPGGICVPVFIQETLSNHRSEHFVTFFARNGQIEYVVT
jgi:RES domain